MPLFLDSLYAPLSCTFIYNLIFWYMEGIQEVDIWVKFHLCLICSSQVFKFQIFSWQQKVPLQTACGWFLGGNPLEFGHICFKFCLPEQCEVMHHIFDSFYSTVKNWSKLGQKNWFSCSFLEVFRLRPVTPYGLRPISLPNERFYVDT